MEKKNEKKKSQSKESLGLRFLYNTAVGRVILKPVASRAVSKIVGGFMDSRLSKPMIKSFVKKNNINLDDFHAEDFKCFNDCFTRKIKDGKRTVDMDPASLISPCDALLSAYTIDKDTRLNIKDSIYSMEDLLESSELAEKYNGGTCLVFRLCVTHYHRYIYIDNGTKEDNRFIKGKLHTVRPIAQEAMPIFKRNCREYTVMHTNGFGDVTQMEVGAMLVGKIKNHHGKGKTVRGEEKGMFLYGGSTIILFIEKDKVSLDPIYLENTQKEIETDVLMGQKLGKKAE
ncbi:MAG: phosphatidylserine decarboxylase [Clostridia bacterium]|nr:phosphatidylserine decarboxylase [Clostridia bacterium]